MPFASAKQLRTCYGTKQKGWDCQKSLKKTDSVCCLPEKSGQTPKCNKKKSEIKRSVTKVQTGPRGGRYKTIREYDRKSKKLLCEKRIYVRE